MEIRLDVSGEEQVELAMGKPCPVEELKSLAYKIINKELNELTHEGNETKSIEISLTFVEPDEIRELNREYRDTDEPTDVLSFPLWEGEDGRFIVPSSDWGEIALGDIVICPKVVAEFAEKLGKRPEDELMLIYVHGLLHLLGYDHATPEDEAVMWRKQEEYLSKGEDDI